MLAMCTVKLGLSLPVAIGASTGYYQAGTGRAAYSNKMPMVLVGNGLEGMFKNVKRLPVRTVSPTKFVALVLAAAGRNSRLGRGVT